MIFSKIKTKKNKESLKRLFLILAEKAFLTFLGLLFIALISGAIIYYRYNTLVETAEIQITKEPLQFQGKTYQKILKIWQERERKFKEADLKEYPDLPEANQEEAVLEESSDSPENGQEEINPEEPLDWSGVDQEQNFR